MNPLLKFYINALEGACDQDRRSLTLERAKGANGLCNADLHFLAIVDDELACRCFNDPVMIGD